MCRVRTARAIGHRCARAGLRDIVSHPIPTSQQGCRFQRRAVRMKTLEETLARVTLAPYIVKATALIGVKRKGGSNMFRHQISTMGILLDYKIVDPVLLKAAVIHDLFEDAPQMPGVTREEIERLDDDGPAVYALV